jgi:membrane protease YdiL (CAAX protease family)
VRSKRTTWALASYAAIVFAFRYGVERSSIGLALGSQLVVAFASFALLLAPLWFFGFGAGEWLRERLSTRSLRILAGAVLGIPYLAYAIPSGSFQWSMAVLMFGLPLVLAGLLESAPSSKMNWQDGFVLAALVAVFMLKVLIGAWPIRLEAMSKLYVADVALYLYVVVRGLPGMGYSFVPELRDFLVGVREWVFFLPFGIGLGTALSFTHFHARVPSGMAVAVGVLVTFLLVAIPEEMFFRGILQNLMESRCKPWIALAVASVLFGLSHFNKGAAFNWRYVLLATIAGVFYGRAWSARHRILASVITHTLVDVVWAMWFK